MPLKEELGLLGLSLTDCTIPINMQTVVTVELSNTTLRPGTYHSAELNTGSSQKTMFIFKESSTTILVILVVRVTRKKLQ